MNLESLIPLIPFVPLLYILFALVQVLRRQRQGVVAVILALLVLAAPIAAYFLSTGLAARLSLINTLAISAGVLFVGSIIIGWLDRRSKDRKQRSSYGIIGTVMSFVLAVFIVVMPMTQTAAAGFSGAATSQNTAAEAAQSAALVKVLETQTGLSATELTAQLTNGSTIASLVAAHNGDLAAVTSAFVTALDELKARGGRETQMLSNVSTDSTEIATKLVQGELPERIQQLLTTQLISGTQSFPSGQGNPNQTVIASGAETTSVPQTKNNGFQPASTGSQPAAQPTSTPTVVPTLAPTETIIRPTPIVFPTATPFADTAVVAADVANGASSDLVAAATAAAATSAPAVTCTLAIDFNLNLRDKPTTDGSTVLLSIPFGNVVTATGHTADNWYSVTYNGQAGWVSGDYVTAQAECKQLPQVEP